MFFDSDVNAYISVSGDLYRPEIGQSMSSGLYVPESLTSDSFADLALSDEDILELNSEYAVPVFSKWTLFSFLGRYPRVTGALEAAGGVTEVPLVPV